MWYFFGNFCDMQMVRAEGPNILFNYIYFNSEFATIFVQKSRPNVRLIFRAGFLESQLS